MTFSFLLSWACAGRYHLLSSCCTICGPPSVPYVHSRDIHPAYVHSRDIHPATVPSVLHLPSITFRPSPSLSRTIPAATGAICPVSTPSAGCIVLLPIRSNSWRKVSWISLTTFLNDRLVYKRIINSKPGVIYWEMSRVYFTGKGTISMLNLCKLFWVFRAGLRLNYQNHCPSILQGFVWSWL